MDDVYRDSERAPLVELVDRLDNLTSKPWHTRAIELRTLRRIARVADTLHDTATRLLKEAQPTPPLTSGGRALTVTEHQALTARLETLLQHVDLLVEEDPAAHWTVVTEVELAAQDLVWQLRQIRREVP
jgi:hypothetical protein